MSELPLAENATIVAARVSGLLSELGVDCAIGGAIALGFWTEPRATLDVDVTLFLPPTDLDRVGDTLNEIDCQFDWADTIRSLQQHGYAEVKHSGFRLDVFLPLLEFHHAAHQRCRSVPIHGQSVAIWDAETITVFKMMFFRDKDMVDVKNVLRTQGAALDRAWVETNLLEIFGARDPRVTRWRELAAEVDATG